MSDIPPAELPGTALPEDPTPPLPSDPSPITDGALPAVVNQLRPIFEEIVNAAVTEAILAVPTPTLRPGVVTAIDIATNSATVTLDEGTEAIGTTIAQIISETPVVNDRVMVMFVPPQAVFIVGIVGGSGVPAGALVSYVGTITADAGGSSGTPPPRGYLWAHGQDVPSASYPSLYAAIGTAFGTGSATGDFVVPDMRGRMPIGIDNMGGSDAGRTSIANTIGTTGGAETHTLSSSNMPSHTHDLGSHTHSFSGSISGSVSISGSTSSEGSHFHNLGGYSVSFAGYGQSSPINGNATNAGSTTTDYNGAHSHSVSGSGSITGGSVSGSIGAAGGSTGSAGSGSSVNHLPPYLVVHWLIKA